MEVRHDLGPKLHEDPDLASCLDLALDEQVPVEVEQVVVPPTPGPRFVPLGRRRIRVGPPARRLPVRGHVPGAPVGVLHGVDQDEALPQDQVHVGIVLRREHVVRFGHGGAAGADLVAMDPVQDHGDHREAGEQLRGLVRRQPPWIIEEPEVLFQPVESGHALRTPDHQHHERTTLPAPGILQEAGPVGGGRVERLHVPDDVRRRRDLGAHVVADHLLRRGDRGVVPRTWGEVLCGRRNLEESGEHQRGDHGDSLGGFAPPIWAPMGPDDIRAAGSVRAGGTLFS